jgi:hypothetical protein
MSTPKVTKIEVPEGAKLPQDHKPAESKDMKMKWAGKDWTIDTEAFDDIDFLEAAENMSYVRCAKLLLGQEQFEAFRENGRDPKTGRSPATELVKFVEEASDRYNAKN